jgi:hypothetical protein
VNHLPAAFVVFLGLLMATLTLVDTIHSEGHRIERAIQSAAANRCR